MKKLLAIALLVSLASPAHAAERCYSPEEIKAERLLRLHSELMVITVTCKQGSTGRDLVRAYTGFTKRHVDQIKQAEMTMSHYYTAAYGGDGTSRLDKLRTKLANEFGQQSANVSAPVFCAQRRDMVTTLFDSPPASLADESMRLYETALTDDPVCGKSVKVAEVAQEPEKTGSEASLETQTKPKKTKKKVKS